MEVINKPTKNDTTEQKIERTAMLPLADSGSNGGDNGDNNSGGDGHKRGFGRPKRPLGWLIAGRVAFVLCGAMFGLMLIGTVVSIIIISNEPYLAPSVQDTQLRQDKIYIKYDDETIFHELALISEKPADLEAVEVTQIAKNRGFQLIFTPKQMSLPQEYKAYFKGNEAQENTNNLTKFEQKAVFTKGEENFTVVSIRPLAGQIWSVGQYEINMPAAGMFGGQIYAYFTINEAK